MAKIDLSFPNIKYGCVETKWDLAPLLYLGGPSTNIRLVKDHINSGKLGSICIERLPLVIKFHETISGQIAGGASRYTIRGKIIQLKNFYTWAEQSNYRLSEENVANVYIKWTEYLLHRQRILKNLKAKSAASLASGVGSLIEEAIGVDNLTKRSRVRKLTNKKNVLSTKADKQVLSETFSFGRFLVRISNSLTVEAIRSRLPLAISLENGYTLEEWSGLKPDDFALTTASAKAKPSYLKKVKERRERWQTDNSWRTRYPIINLRIEAELLIFIAQTGMNLAQAHKLRAGNFSYSSHNDGYLVKRVYKSRAQGEVEFEIYSEYRVFFERYLAWRKDIFKDHEDERLFPIRSPKYQSIEVAPNFERIRDRCEKADISYVGPRALRNTRINWLIRKSRDVGLVAEMAQHTQQTLLAVYEKPHHQAAAIEISRFHRENEAAMIPPGPGICARGVGDALFSDQQEAPEPNCINPAGCLFCNHQRDIATFDHIWSLSSYKHYQILLLATYRSPQKPRKVNPVELTIDRLAAKLGAFRDKDESFADWVSEAQARIDEGDFHPQWDIFIRLLEET